MERENVLKSFIGFQYSNVDLFIYKIGFNLIFNPKVCIDFMQSQVVFPSVIICNAQQWDLVFITEKTKSVVTFNLTFSMI